MKQVFIIIILLLFIVCSCKNKEKPKLSDVNISETKFEFARIKCSDIKKIEKINNGTEYTKFRNITLSKEYFPEIDKYEFDQPIIYLRDTLNMQTRVSYFFTKKDSVVRLIEYSWNKGIEKKPYIDELYNFNKKQISNSLNDLGNVDSLKMDSWWRKDVRWDNDSSHIYSFLLGYKDGYRTRVIIRQK